MTYTPTKAGDYAKSQVGISESPPGSNCQGYSDWQYGVRCPGGGWCMSFVSRCTFEAGYRFEGATHGPRGFSYTGAAEAWARARGLWRDPSFRFKLGDWIIFNWDGGGTDHGELVLADDGVWIITVGGNTSNAVKFRRRDRHYVTGGIAFSASDQAAPPPPVWKVRPMYDPARPLRALLRHPQNRGWWAGLGGGRVLFLDANTDSVIEGGMVTPADQAAFQGRTLARLEHRQYQKDGKTVHGYTIVATSGERYVPETQH